MEPPEQPRAPFVDVPAPVPRSSAASQATTPTSSSDSTSGDASSTPTWEEQTEAAGRAIDLVPPGPVKAVLTQLLHLILSNGEDISHLYDTKLDQF